MKRLNYCAARFDSNTLVSYSTLIYTRTGNYTFVYRYHSATTTQHFYKFCDKIGISRKEARYLWNDKANRYGIIAVSNDDSEPTRYYYNGDDLWNDRDRFLYPEEVPEMGYGITNC